MIYRSKAASIAFLAQITFREEVSPEHILDQRADRGIGLPDAPVSRRLLDVHQYALSSLPKNSRPQSNGKVPVCSVKCKLEHLWSGPTMAGGDRFFPE